MNLDRVRIWALLMAELLGVVRDRWALVGLIVVHLGIGALGPAAPGLVAWFTPDLPTPEEASPSYDCEPATMQKVAFANPPPAWLEWPDTPVDADDADVLLTFALDETPARIEVLPLVDSVGTQAVTACLRSQRTDEIRRRLDKLGITEDPNLVVVTRRLAPKPAADAGLPPISQGVAITGALLLLIASVFLELGPRARASGWLETWLTLPGSRADLVAAWYGVGLVLGSAGVGLVLVGDALASIYTGVYTVPVPALLLPPVIALVAAIGVRAFLDVPDLRTAMVQSVPVLLLLLVLVGFARVIDLQHPGLGGWLPAGGLLLAVTGLGSGILAPTLSGLAAAAFLLHDSARALDRLDVRSGSASRVAARRANGNYTPEVLLLTLLAMAGVGAWAPPELLMRDVAARTMLSMVVFLGLPAVVTPYLLRLDPRALLSWRAPPVRAFLLIPVVVAGTLSLGSLAWKLAAWIFPPNALTAAFDASFEGFDSPLGLVAVTVLPGVCEELLFRGAMLGLLRRRLPTWAAILIQAAAFALLHGLAVRLPHTFALGVVFGILTVGTGSLWPSMIAHLLHNLVAVQLPADVLVGWADTPWAYGVAILGIGAAVAARRRPPAAPPARTEDPRAQASG